VNAKQVKKLPPKFGHATVVVSDEQARAGEEVELQFDKIVDETSDRDKTLKVMQQLSAEAELKKALDKYEEKFTT
jgi:hypothetical protein